MHNGCHEQNGLDYKCQNVVGSKTITVLGGQQFQITDKCVCFCDFEGESSIIHTLDPPQSPGTGNVPSVTRVVNAFDAAGGHHVPYHLQNKGCASWENQNQVGFKDENGDTAPNPLWNNNTFPGIDPFA
jgi:hypothetical protein